MNKEYLIDNSFPSHESVEFSNTIQKKKRSFIGISPIQQTNQEKNAREHILEHNTFLNLRIQ